MRILAIGDPHGSKKIREMPLRDADLILLTGDIGKADLARKFAFDNISRKKQGLPKLKLNASQARAMHLEIHRSTLDVFRYLSRHAPVYSIQGNVGIPGRADVREDWEKHRIKTPSTADILSRMRNVYLVKNSLRVINGLRVGFLEYFKDVNWVRDFKPVDYSDQLRKARGESAKARRVLDRFGLGLDILVCHQPPYGILDRVDFQGAPVSWQGKHAGSQVILDYIRRCSPRYVFCGHIHEGQGMKKVGKTDVYNLGVAGWKCVDID